MALLLIDVINDLEFAGGELLLPAARQMAVNIARLKARAAAAGIPVIYVNDNFGKWRSDVRRLVSHCLKPGVRGREIARLLRPQEDDYFVLKPRHSGFFASALEVLLQALGARTLILTGLAGNICVLYTANDAYMRGYRLLVPGDCTASNTPSANEQSLRQMRHQLKGDTSESSALDLTRLAEEGPSLPTGQT